MRSPHLLFFICAILLAALPARALPSAPASLAQTPSELSGQVMLSWSAVTDATANSGNAADLADPDSDGLVNLLGFALGTSPLVTSAAPTVQVSGLSPQPSYLTLTFFRARPPSEITYEVQATSDLLSPSSWSVIAINPGNIGTEVTVSDPTPLPSSGPRFLRLRVTAP